MDVNANEFDSFEQQFLDLVGEFQTLTASESSLRETIRIEATRAEAAEARRDAAERAAIEARNSAAAATAGATQAAAALAKMQEDYTTIRMQLDLADRQQKHFEERCTELSCRKSSLERELSQLRPAHAALAAAQRQLADLQERVKTASQDARNEANRLEAELRRVERCASGGAEIRERARLAASAHARGRRLDAAELQHAARELRAANAEISRLTALVAELQLRLSNHEKSTKGSDSVDLTSVALSEVRAALEAERVGTARLERALAAALADNATLATKVNSADNDITVTQGVSTPPPGNSGAAAGPLESFLAD